MDSTLPQMQSFDFDRLDPIALEDTLAYLRQYPEPPAEHVALFGGHQEMLDDAVGEMDWMAEPLQDGSQSSDVSAVFTPDWVFSKSLTRVVPLQRESSNELPVPSSLEFFCGTYRHIPGLGRCSAPYEDTPDDRMAGGGSTPLQHFNLAVKLKTSSGQSKCTWDGCEQTSPGDEELRAHLDDHSSDAQARWTRGSKCTWQGCKSKAVFKTPSLFKHHLLNIHARPLLCPQPHCSCKKPFKNKHELERHNSTQHSVERKWECPYDTCPSEIRSFARKDKWLKHIRETQHDNDSFCPHYHCYLSAFQSGRPFKNREEIGLHFGRNHVDRYGCALGSCGNIRKSDRWDWYNLHSHLRDQHKIYVGYPTLVKELEGTDRLFRIHNIPSRDLKDWVDCKICASQTATQSLPNTTATPFPHSKPAPL